MRELNDGIADLVLFEPPGATLAPSLIALTDVGTKCSGEPPVADDDNPERMRPEASLCDRLRRRSRTSTSTSRWLQLETVLLLFATGQHAIRSPAIEVSATVATGIVGPIGGDAFTSGSATLPTAA